MRTTRSLVALLVLVMTWALMPGVGATGPSDRAQEVRDLWTAERIASATPRDLIIDARGLGYLRGADGHLTPYGHSIAPQRAPETPFARGGNKNVRDSDWTFGGVAQQAVGRILFDMDGGTYVCSGTVVGDSAPSPRSIILTAGHCVFDDVKKAFATNVIFIPNQDETTGSGTDSDCSNDPLGCWVVDFGVVDVNWANNQWPDNIPWDYAYYVVEDGASHSGAGGDVLDSAVGGGMAQDFAMNPLGDRTYALGYSYSQDPNLRYCSQGLGDYPGTFDVYFLDSCGLSGGASGGGWFAPMNTDTGVGTLISVNSFGFQGQPGMGGPKLAGSTASALFDKAEQGSLSPVGGGYVIGGDGTTTTTVAPTTTSTPTTTTTIPGGDDSFTTDSINNGGTWTAVVLGPDSFSGKWSDGNACTTTSGQCGLTGIPKRVGSVTFTPDGGESLIIFKP